jgi:hypothetical protein
MLSGSPFFDSSIYITSAKANIRNAPSLKSEIVFEAERNQAFKHLETILANKDELSWYKIQYYDPKEFDIYYKTRTKSSVKLKNFSKILELYEKPSLTANSISILPNKRNFRYDNKKAILDEWVRVRIYKIKTAYIATSISTKIDRPYFLTEIALEAIEKNPNWDYRTRQNILNGELFQNMSPAMAKAVKGEPDHIYEDKTGRSLYYSWIYGSQTLNFRNHRLTSW